MIPIGEVYSKGWQHKGWGETLIKEAERIASDGYDMKKMVVMSALGTREYYSKFGYRPNGVYMAKYLKK
jgi:elongator complex protein 3